MSAWDRTPAAILRARAAGRPTIPPVAGLDDTRPHAEQYPDAAAAHRAAWGTARWAYEAVNPVTAERTTQYADNTEVRAVQERLAAEGPPIGWCEFPHLGYAPPELAGLHAAAVAENTTVRVGRLD